MFIEVPQDVFLKTPNPNLLGLLLLALRLSRYEDHLLWNELDEGCGRMPGQDCHQLFSLDMANEDVRKALERVDKKREVGQQHEGPYYQVRLLTGRVGPLMSHDGCQLVEGYLLAKTKFVQPAIRRAYTVEAHSFGEVSFDLLGSDKSILTAHISQNFTNGKVVLQHVLPYSLQHIPHLP
jgi:hypothetical protein